MSAKRLYVETSLVEGQTLVLDSNEAHYLGRVMRSRSGDTVYLFNGDGRQFPAVIRTLTKRTVTLEVASPVAGLREPDVALSLALALSRNEKMDLAIQKAVELGVASFQPIIVSRSVMQLDAKRIEKRMQHWHAIIVAATQQCGRSALMRIAPPTSLDALLVETPVDHLRLIADPEAANSLSTVLQNPLSESAVNLIVGPEGGFSDEEMQAACSAGFRPISAGPRVLRTETAAIALVAAIQCAIGDWR
ncbi:MAG: 16S rRNA (uracil(1498)-N(3))-methyltransferase [Pseudomonadota bacterium]